MGRFFFKSLFLGSLGGVQATSLFVSGGGEKRDAGKEETSVTEAGEK